jgi:putative isomerase
MSATTHLRRLLAAALILALSGPAVAAPPVADAAVDVLDMHGTPASAADRSFNIFFDAGAWHGYSLPLASDAGSGFSGPFVHSIGAGRWAGRRLAQVTLAPPGGGAVITLREVGSQAGPGYLQRHFQGQGLQLRQTLFFADAQRALVRIELESSTSRALDVAVENEAMLAPGDRLVLHSGAVTQTFAGSADTVLTRLHQDVVQLLPRQARNQVVFASSQPVQLEAAKPLVLVLEQQFSSGPGPAVEVDADAAWSRNRARWNGYLQAIKPSHVPGVPDATAQRIALKAVQTLIGNWRAARGDLRHDGVIPSYSADYFNGFWAWDSWKHAVALAHFAPDLARDQMRAMFDYQAANGMVADSVYLDAKENNWKSTAPPAMPVSSPRCTTSWCAITIGGSPSATTTTTAWPNTVPPMAPAWPPRGKAAWTTRCASMTRRCCAMARTPGRWTRSRSTSTPISIARSWTWRHWPACWASWTNAMPGCVMPRR